MQTWGWDLDSTELPIFPSLSFPSNLHILSSFLFSDSTFSRGKKEGNAGMNEKSLHKRPIYERKGKAVNSALVCSKDFPCNCLLKWNMAPHGWHADSGGQVSETLILRRKRVACKVLKKVKESWNHLVSFDLAETSTKKKGKVDEFGKYQQ